MRIKVIVNPGAGKPEPVLSILNDTFGAAGWDWDVAVTHKGGDGFKAAREASEQSYDLLGAYGGDGTASEVASALALGGPPMAILPGGTGNALAGDLGIPATLAEAASFVACGEYCIQAVDVGRVGDSRFILRLTMGFEASVVEAATRELKDRFGWLAYAFASVRTLTDPPIARYRLTVDGETAEAQGVACIIANSAATGVLGVDIAEGVDVSDGLLDVIVVESANVAAFASSAADAAEGKDSRTTCRWRGKRIRVESEPRQAVLSDGEDAGQTPVEALVVPSAVQVAVPKTPIKPE